MDLIIIRFHLVYFFLFFCCPIEIQAVFLCQLAHTHTLKTIVQLLSRGTTSEVIWQFHPNGITLTSSDSGVHINCNLESGMFKEFRCNQTITTTIDTAELLLATKNLKRTVPVVLFVEGTGMQLGILVSMNSLHLRKSLIQTFSVPEAPTAVPSGYTVYEPGEDHIRELQGIPIETPCFIQLIKEYSQVSRSIIIRGNDSYLEWSIDDSRSLHMTDKRHLRVGVG